jgi:outer membrane protein assembly factor BamB
MVLRFAVMGVLCAVAAESAVATAAPCGPNSEWNAPFNVVTAGAATQPSDNTSFVSMASFTYAASGTTAYKIDNANGTVVWERSFTATVQNSVTPVVLRSGVEVVFVASDDGFLYKLSGSTGAILASFDAHRRDVLDNVICANDALRAMPAVILYNFAGPAFQAAVGDDLVVIATLDGCGDTQANRIIGVRASNFTAPAWVFDAQSVAQQMDFAAAGCALDYAKLRAYCATNATGSQPSLWAIDLRTGGLVWSKRVGAIRTTPQVVDDRLLVVTYLGGLWARHVDTGTGLWTVPLFSGTSTRAVHNLWREFRNGYDGVIVVADNVGTLHRVTEAKDGFGEYYGHRQWQSSLGSSVTSSAAVHSDYGFGYVGLANGKVSQVDLFDGTSNATLAVGTGLVYPPAMGMQAGTTAINRLVVADGVKVKRYCVPQSNGTMGQFAPVPGHNPSPRATCGGPGPFAVACATADGEDNGDGACVDCPCDPSADVSYHKPINNGGNCSPPLGACDVSQVVAGACPAVDPHGRCQAAKCTWSFDANPCAAGGMDGARCNGTNFCCNGVCVDPHTDIMNCGACNAVCPGGKLCMDGGCV